MTLYELTKYIESVAKKQPNVHSIVEHSVFNLNERKDNEYTAFAWVLANHYMDDNFIYYGFNLFIVDRLTDDQSNKLMVESYAIDTLQNIINEVLENDGIDLYNRVQFTCFSERFKDLTAGAFANITFRVNKEYCAELYE